MNSSLQTNSLIYAWECKQCDSFEGFRRVRKLGLGDKQLLRKGARDNMMNFGI